MISRTGLKKKMEEASLLQAIGWGAIPVSFAVQLTQYTLMGYYDWDDLEPT